ncbi:hypothetical protein [Actinoplanes sp. NPDC049118]|uniref:hypothetical protein n=1 Tax=Actinoplanes sp. NPDC049118 TaxID=3155769 RepID=UPI0033FFF99A
MNDPADATDPGPSDLGRPESAAAPAGSGRADTAAPDAGQPATAEPEPADPTAEAEPADPTAEPEPAEPTAEPEPADPTAEPEPADPTAEADEVAAQPADSATAEPDDFAPAAAVADEVPPEADETDEVLPEAAEVLPEADDAAAAEPEPEPEPAWDGVDPLVPAAGSGLQGWALRVGAVLRESAAPFVVIALLAALPMYYFVARVRDLFIVLPAFFDLVGNAVLIMFPLLMLAYYAVATTPTVICLAGTVAVAVVRAATGTWPGVGTVWRLVAFRLRPLWMWLTGFALVPPLFSLLLTFVLTLNPTRVEPAAFWSVRIAMAGLSTALLTLAGMVGCVALVEGGDALRRAWRLLSPAPATGLAAAALTFVVLPEIATALWGAVGGTAGAVLGAMLWSVASLVAYAQARSRFEPVTSRTLLAELADEFEDADPVPAAPETATAGAARVD